jgi:alpha-mannosidase
MVLIDSTGLTNATVSLRSRAWSEPLVKSVAGLPAGRQTVTINVSPMPGSEPVTVHVGSSGGGGEFGPFTVPPARQWTVYLAQHTHTDIGYTRPQTEILSEHLRYIDYALDYCDLTDGYPDDARFRWTCETAWAVREYLQGRPPGQLERLKRRLEEGRIEICGLLLNMSEIASESALAALVRPLREIKAELGVQVRTAMQNDVNGAGWCLADYLPDLGIRYLNMGINQTRSILPFDKPTAFWWESPSGKRLLAYRADHYMTANFWGIEKGDFESFKSGVEKYLLSLEQRHYPFDRIGVQFSGYFTDNAPPSTIACDLVKDWNEKYEWPRLRLSTAQEFLSYVETEHSANLPVHRQAWPDWWTDGFGSAARETALARETETAMQVNHGLLAMASILGAPVQPATMRRAAAIQDDLLFYHEHTYGAAESISDPLAENTQVQWGQKASYVWAAGRNASLLREEAFGLVQGFLPRAAVPTLAVFNTLDWPRSGLVRVFIDHEILPSDRQFRIVDGAQTVPAQAMERRTEGTYWALWVSDVPSFGLKILRIEVGDQPLPRETPGPDSVTLENAFYSLKFAPDKGAIQSLVDKETGQELVDQQATWGFGQCFYETMPANREMKPEVFKRTAQGRATVKPGARGPIWQSLHISADLEGCSTNNGLRGEIRLFETEKRIELHFAIRKLPVRTPESIYVALPFNAPGSVMLYEAQGGLVRPGLDQIPGSSSDWQTLQSFIALRSPAGQIIAGSEQVPLVQLGDLNLGKWQRVTAVEKPHVYSWVMNNYWFTNFRAEQEGEFKWHYYLTSTKDTTRSAATRFGWGSRVPLVTRVLPPVKAGRTHYLEQLSALSINAPGVVVVEARPGREPRSVFLHLREVEGQRVSLRGEDLHTQRPIAGADEVNVLEETILAQIGSLTLQPYEAKFVRLRFR